MKIKTKIIDNSGLGQKKPENTGTNKNYLLGPPLCSANLTGIASFRAPADNFRITFCEGLYSHL